MYKVALVSNQDEREFAWVAALHLFQGIFLPLVESIKGIFSVKVEHEDCSVGTSIESESNGLELLLASGIPHLKSNTSVADYDLFLGKICGGGSLDRVSDHAILDEARQQSCLAYTHVAKH